MMRDQIRFEGLTAEELLQLQDDEIDIRVLSGNPVVFAVGSAKVPGPFAIRERVRHVELAQIDGGGEGVLLVGALSIGRCTLLRAPNQV